MTKISRCDVKTICEIAGHCQAPALQELTPFDALKKALMIKKEASHTPISDADSSVNHWRLNHEGELVIFDADSCINHWGLNHDGELVIFVGRFLRFTHPIPIAGCEWELFEVCLDKSFSVWFANISAGEIPMLEDGESFFSGFLRIMTDEKYNDKLFSRYFYERIKSNIL